MPVLVGLARGERPGLAAAIGMVAALGGIVIISRSPDAAVATPVPAPVRPAAHPRAAIALGLGAALGFGLFFVLLVLQL